MTNPINPVFSLNSLSVASTIKCQARGISIFRINKRTSINEQKQFTIVTSYGSRGFCPCYAFHGFSDEVIGKAGGCGYDKTNTALERGISKLLGQDLGADGGCGFNAVADACAKLGWTLIKIV